MAKKVSYMQQEDPSFLKQFKQKIGYKEGPNVETKRQELQFDDDDDRPETEEDKPVVVVLKKGDLTAEEAAQLHGNDLPQTECDPNSSQTSEDCDTGGKIVFKKPVKRSADHGDSDLNVSSSKKQKDLKTDKLRQAMDKSKKVKNSSLLSFGDDEEEEDD